MLLLSGFAPSLTPCHARSGICRYMHAGGARASMEQLHDRCVDGWLSNAAEPLSLAASHAATSAMTVLHRPDCKFATLVLNVYTSCTPQHMCTLVLNVHM
eukprot:TRINITY_DN389_c1_g3_i1.p2 TRINITY_DN389_c1_g3~~TRINITY_DN389_c1_g3_i1.p2  ORF type:complete len:100 (-),score=10.49 TRINITY_DN389_c1_g3_i1:312-611(-)